MAVIGSIRKHSTFLVIVIGVALAAFILGDFTKKQRMGSRSVVAGEVAGEKITIIDFNNKVDQNIEATKQQKKKEKLTPEEIFRIKNNTWSQMVNTILMNKQYDALGLTVTSDELFDMVQGPNPHPLVQQSFINPNTGKFDRNIVMQFLETLDQNKPEIKQQWIQFEDYLKKDRLREKYNTLILKGYYIPKELALMEYSDENDKADIQYVSRKYAMIPDTLVDPTEEDYAAVYEKEKERFKEEPNVDFAYVIFEVIPSIKDLQDSRKEVNQIYEEFKTTVDIPRFVQLNSDNPYDSSWKTKGQLPVQIDSIMFNSPVGTIAKPYMENNTFHIARLVDVAFRPDSLKASHILISYRGALKANSTITRTKEQAKQLADSLYNVIKRSPGKLEALSLSFSDDPSAKTNKGNLGWFADGMMVHQFNEAVINTKVKRVTMVETPFGFHIIKVTGKKDLEKKVKVAMIDQEVLASNQTYQQIFAKASKLASETHNLDEFDAAIEKDGYNKRLAQKIHKMDNHIAGLKSPRQIIRWAFKDNTNVGQVSEVFDLEGQFVVAVLTNRIQEGYPSLDQVKTRLNTKVYNNLKAQLILTEIKPYGDDMQKIAGLADFKMDEMPALTFVSRNIKGYGTENEIIGQVFGTEEGQKFGPVIGKGGVFIVKLKKLTKASQPDNLDIIKTRLFNRLKSQIDRGEIYIALKDNAEIEDDRINFY
ncbi:MAG TPA: hypothetical protein ENH02_01780 [Bacteroidetes bacterium]|nr:hypothetical protein [Bacteroidota bacterium]